LIIKKNAIDFDKISDLIKEGSIFCYPTDTLYGLGCRYDNKTSIEKIISLKGREKNHFFTLLFKDSKMLNNFFSISELEKNIINKFLPGKLSILLTPKDKNMFYNNFIGLDDKVSCRISSDSFTKEIYNKIDFPIVSTSANISGNENLFNISDIINTFEKSLDFIVDYGDIGYSRGSTILNVNKDSLNLIRDGDIQFETITKELDYGNN
jgi:L-threonylcarbamoyladenylate synthase|tara:strand:- start:10932 stop:11558 length:627 start_codon:yes stop_codon:yes gene_type:complete